MHASAGLPERARVLGSSAPLGRSGRPEEVAEVVYRLLRMPRPTSLAASSTVPAGDDRAGPSDRV